MMSANPWKEFTIGDIPTLDDADKFGHVLWFNPKTGTIVAPWNKPSEHYTHWKRTDMPDVIGDAFNKWYNHISKLVWTNDDYQKLQDAFRAGAEAALK